MDEGHLQLIHVPIRKQSHCMLLHTSLFEVDSSVKGLRRGDAEMEGNLVEDCKECIDQCRDQCIESSTTAEKTAE